MPETKKTAKRSATRDESTDQWTAEERAAIKERNRELKAASKGADGESDLLAKIAEMSGPDRAMAERIHAIVRASVPALESRTWYGMPAYAKGGKVICFFQPAGKFKARYSTLGFNDPANLDDGSMWPTSFALTELSSDSEAAITALVKKAAS